MALPGPHIPSEISRRTCMPPRGFMRPISRALIGTCGSPLLVIGGSIPGFWRSSSAYCPANRMYLPCSQQTHSQDIRPSKFAWFYGNTGSRIEAKSASGVCGGGGNKLGYTPIRWNARQEENLPSWRCLSQLRTCNNYILFNNMQAFRVGEATAVS